MEITDLAGILEFLRAAESLKDTTRSAFTSSGRPETVAAHTWRLCLMALVLEPYFPGISFDRLVKMCIIHDLGEAIGGDIPATNQTSGPGKSSREREDLLTLLKPLPEPLRDEITELWEEYEQAATEEAMLSKALDKLETILQHTQGKNPDDFDYRFNLGYGREYTSGDEVIVALRKILDEETERRAAEADGNGIGSAD